MRIKATVEAQARELGQIELPLTDCRCSFVGDRIARCYSCRTGNPRTQRAMDSNEDGLAMEGVAVFVAVDNA